MDLVSELLLSSLSPVYEDVQPPKEKYQWTRLADPTSMVRMILLYPGCTGPLRCSIFDVTLAYRPEYEAISYHWGDPTPKHKLRIGNKVVLIARSIFEALLRVRQWNQFRILWIDGLCISQHDEEEKSLQILLMKSIFRQARLVLVYLGPQAEGSQNLSSLFYRIAKVWERERARYVAGTNSREGFLRAEQYCKAGLPEKKIGKWDELARFFCRPYFRRVWVIQELVLAREIKLLCGGWEIPWADFDLVLSAIRVLDLPFVDDREKEKILTETAMDICITIQALRISLRKSEKWKFLQLLRRCRNADCSDDKDKIYGLLGLGEAFGEKLPVPNYGKKKHDIYEDYARRFIEQGDGIDLLYNCFAESSWCGPSWVPNWTAKLSGKRLAPYPTLLQDQARASFASAHSQPRIFVDVHTATVHVDGVFVSEISHMPFSQHRIAGDGLERMSDLVSIATELEDLWKLRTAAQYLTGEAQDEVIWRIMLCNRSPESEEEVSSEYGEVYQMFKRLCALLLGNHGDFKPGWSCEIPQKDEWQRLKDHFHNQVHQFINACSGFCRFRRRCLMLNGLLGQVPPLSQEGDKIFIPCGSAVPFILRAKGSDYRIIGECYIHGTMKGEAFHDPARTIQTISLI